MTAKSKFILYMLLLVSILKIQAQEIPTTHVSGMVTDSLFKPVEFAAVQLFSVQDSSLFYGAMTTIEGTYTIKNIKFGKYKLKVSSIGYQSSSKTIDLSKARPLLPHDCIVW